MGVQVLHIAHNCCTNTPMKIIKNCTSAAVHMFEGGRVGGWGPGTSNQSAQLHNCTCSREGERVDGVQVAEPAPRRSVAGPPLERRKPQSYFLFSQFFGFKTCLEHFIGYIYSCRICSWKAYSSINYPPSHHPDVLTICTYIISLI